MRPFTSNFAYDDLVVKVTSVHEKYLTWLREFLSPAFRIDKDPEFSCQITVTVDRGRFEAALGKGPHHTSQNVPCFTFDNHVANYPLWHSIDGETWVRDSELDTLYIVKPGQRHIEILSRKPALPVRIALLRVIRELITHNIPIGTAYLLHAAAFSVNDKGILISGAKKAGKTSLLIHAMRHAATKFISNDRVVLSTEEDTAATIKAMPTVIAIRPQTIDLFPEFPFSAARHWRARMTLKYAKALSSTDNPSSAPGKLDLTPAQFCDLLGRTAVSSARLERIIFPRVDPDINGMSIEPLEPVMAAARLAETLLPLKDSCLIKAMPPDYRRRISPDPALEKRLFSATSICNSYDCHMGLGAFTGHESVNKFFESIF